MDLGRIGYAQALAMQRSANQAVIDGTGPATLMLLANLFLLAWDYDRWQHVLPLRRIDVDRSVSATTSKFPIWFFAFVLAAVASVILVNAFIYDIRPGNSRIECTNGCRNSGDSNASRQFCVCIYDEGRPLDTCLDGYQGARGAGD